MNPSDFPLEILLVEDSAADVRLTKEALEAAKLRSTLYVAGDGESALEFLRDPRKPHPDLVLLDLNLPGMDGREVLVEIKNDVALAAIPVVVLTTSSAEEDVRSAYSHHGNCYVVKPMGLDQFIKVIQSIHRFWLTVARLPPKQWPQEPDVEAS